MAWVSHGHGCRTGMGVAQAWVSHRGARCTARAGNKSNKRARGEVLVYMGRRGARGWSGHARPTRARGTSRNGSSHEVERINEGKAGKGKMGGTTLHLGVGVARVWRGGRGRREFERSTWWGWTRRRASPARLAQQRGPIDSCRWHQSDVCHGQSCIPVTENDVQTQQRLASLAASDP